MSMSISERLEFEAMKRRLAALEAELSDLKGGRAPAPLRQRNAARQADARRLDEAIVATLAEHPQPDRLTAKHVLRALERANFQPLPSERSVLRHLTTLRGHGHTRRVAVDNAIALSTRGSVMS